MNRWITLLAGLWVAAAGPALAATPCAKGHITADGCELKGTRQAVAAGTYRAACGVALELDAQNITLAHDANAAIVVSDNANKAQVYRTNGNNLLLSGTVDFPAYYCESYPALDPDTGLPIVKIARIPVTPRNQFIAVSDRNNVAAIAVDNFSEEYILLKRNGNTLTYTAPKANPGAFTKLGVADADAAGCISKDELFDPLPYGFGDILFGYSTAVSCSVDYIYPGSEDYINCAKHVHYLNSKNLNLYAGPNKSFTVGSVDGGGRIRHVARVGTGDFNPTSNGLTYDGPLLTFAGGNRLFLSTNVGLQTHYFLNGATFFLDDNYVVVVDAPGRITLNGKGDMQLIDGGAVQDTMAKIVRVIAPMAYVQFGDERVIEGLTHGDVALAQPTLLPVLPGGVITQPHDSSIDVMCPQD